MVGGLRTKALSSMDQKFLSLLTFVTLERCPHPAPPRASLQPDRPAEQGPDVCLLGGKRSGKWRLRSNGAADTHTATADEDNEEGLQDASRPHHPGQSKEQDHPKDVLHAGQVHTHQGAHAG